MLHHHHLPHVPHVPHFDLRAMGHDAAVAAELALAALVLTGSIEAHAVGQVVGASRDMPAVPPAGAAAAQVSTAEVVDLTPSVALDAASDGVVARVHIPAGGTNRIDVVDSDGNAVATVAVGHALVRIENLAAGRYSVVVAHEGAVERVGDATVSSAMVVRSPAVVVAVGDVVTVVQEATS